MCLIPHSLLAIFHVYYKSKEYNSMDILDSIFSDQRQKDVMNYIIEYLFNDSESHE